MKKFTYIILAVLTLLINYTAKAEKPEVSPYGACSHLIREEFKNHEQTMQLMQAAGIQWARADFSWSGVQPAPDTWKFERCDAILATAKKYNIQILPILDYSNKIGDPAWQHLDKWEVYVRKTVERYQDQIPVWEVWNEQNLSGFWENPNPTNYLPLLKKTYETIKLINPDLKVAVGGYSGTPFKYIESLYKLGGGRYFDIMNVHPYSHPRPPERELEERLIALRELMTKYGDKNKPVWITEIGWPTHTPEPTPDGILLAALKNVLPKKKIYRIICLKDPGSDAPGWLTRERIADKLPPNSSIQVLDYEAAIKTLDCYEIDVLVMPPSENFYLDGIDRIVRYVKEGGTVVDLHGMPFWYGYTKNSDGEWEKTNNSAYHKLRIQPEAWWYKKDVIPEEMAVKAVGPAAKVNPGKEKIIAKRFLKPYKFKEGDKFIPLLQGKTEKYTGTAAAIYDFNSDWKGAVIVSTLSQGGGHAVDENGQAAILPRAQLIARRTGVKRIFWYEFQAPERLPHDKESHFGILHKDFSEKPAYATYRTLTAQCPAGSTFIDKEWKREDKSLYYPQWRCPDGTPAGAIWSFNAPGIYKVNFKGGTPSFKSSYGKPLNPPISDKSAIISIDNAPVYFQGAEITKIGTEYNYEDGLKAALEMAFDRAEVQYTALLKDMENSENQQPRRWQNNKLVKVGPEDWTSGFFPASLWYLYEHTGADKWYNAAMQYTAIQEKMRNHSGTHDIGFMIYCPYGNALRLAKNKAGIKEILLDSAAALCKRYVPSLGMIRSWDSYNNPVIIDNMMNLELLMWAAKNSENPLFDKVAISHADQTNKRHFRADGSAYHIVDYNPFSRKVFGYYAGQGASADSPWARGQSWGLYGFTMMYRESGKKEYLQRAIKCADFLINHPNLPKDKIPYWDYGAAEIPYAPRDVAAAAIMASALMELCTFDNVPNAAKYRSIAVQQLLSLSSPAYLAPAGRNGNFILMHAVGNLPGNSEIDVPLNYADYYYLEALTRFNKLCDK